MWNEHGTIQRLQMGSRYILLPNAMFFSHSPQCLSCQTENEHIIEYISVWNEHQNAQLPHCILVAILLVFVLCYRRRLHKPLVCLLWAFLIVSDRGRYSHTFRQLWRWANIRTCSTTWWALMTRGQPKPKDGMSNLHRIVRKRTLPFYRDHSHHPVWNIISAISRCRKS